MVIFYALTKLLEKGASFAVIDNPDQQGERKILVENVLANITRSRSFPQKATETTNCRNHRK